ASPRFSSTDPPQAAQLFPTRGARRIVAPRVRRIVRQRRSAGCADSRWRYGHVARGAEKGWFDMESESASATSVPGRILVVEDDRQILAIVSGLLEDEGYEVETASDGKQALARLH